MLGGIKPRGFTIIETMIFLAVSGLLFVAVLAFIGGKTGQTEFDDGIHTAFSQFQNISQGVANGFYYNANNPFYCYTNDSNTQPIVTVPNGTHQGQNLGCTFIGTIVQMDYNGNPTMYAVYTLVGRQFVYGSGGKQDVTSLEQAYPEVLQIPGDSCASSTSKFYTLPDDLKFQSITFSSNGYNGSYPYPKYTTAYGYLSSYATNSALGSSLASGSQNVALVPIPTSTHNFITSTKPPAATPCANLIATADSLTDQNNPAAGVLYNTGALHVTNDPYNPTGGIVVCLKSGTTVNQYAEIQLGDGGNPQSISLKETGSSTCQ